MMALSFTPGQTVAAPDWEALFAQHGGSKSQQRRQPTKAEQEAALATDEDLDQNPIYRYYAADGSYVEARAAPNGDYQIVAYQPSEKFKQTQTSQSQQGTQVGSDTRTDAQGNTIKVTRWRRPDGTEYSTEDTVTKAPATATTGEDVKPLQGHPGVHVRTRSVKDAQGNTQQVTEYVDDQGRPVREPTAPPRIISADPGKKYWVVEDPDTHLPKAVKNPTYRADSKIEYNQANGRWYQITEDEDGTPVINELKPGQGTITPSQIPVLQARYGQISQGLGQVLGQLNGQLSRGEITQTELNDRFKAAHQQAEVQVNEINSILENSKAVWTTQVQERGQTFTEAANRRSFASSIMGNAMSTGREIAGGALPGSGRAIAEGVMTLMDLGQRYAQGMGGFPSMQSTPLPPALQQAASMNLPGFGPEAAGAPPAAGGQSPPGGPSPQPSAVGPVGQGITATTAAAVDPTRANVDAANRAVGAGSQAAFGALGVGPGAAGAPLLRPPPPVPGQSPVAPPLGTAPAVGGPTPLPLPFTGQNPNPRPLEGPAQRGIEPIPLAVPGQGSIEPIPLAVPGQGSIEPLSGGPIGMQSPGMGPLSALGSTFGAGMAGSPMGVPRAVGGGGLFDPNQEMQSMLSASMTGGYGGAGTADPAWEEAVRRAMGMLG
jgi:hypothetical protein